MLENKIAEWVGPKLKEEGLFLVELKCLPGNKIQLFIDGDENVTIEKCAKVSRFLEAYLDSSEEVPAKYNLEVSSPGAERSLLVPRQYVNRIGRNLKIQKMDGETFSGKLIEADDLNIKLELEAKKKTDIKPVLELQYGEIKKAVVNFDFNKK